MNIENPERVFRSEAPMAVVGSFVRATLPRDLPGFFRDGILVDPRNDTPMEMDAYSLYLGLKALERIRGGDYSVECASLCDAVLARLRSCGGFWSHGAWTGSDREVHMRFTAAAIRLLAEAYADGLITEESIVTDALRRHLTWSEPLDEGRWFLHDSLEAAATGIANPHRPLANRVLGSSPANSLALNTHLDTLSTLLHLLAYLPMPASERKFFEARLAEGVLALDRALGMGGGVAHRIFSLMDSALRQLLFQTHADQGRTVLQRWLGRKMKGVMHRIYFPLRRRIRSFLPGFSFSDGYLERDIALTGTSFEYHLVNVYDLARFVIQARESGLVHDSALLERCAMLADRGIDYAVRSAYWRFLKGGATQHTRMILLCEAMLARLGASGGEMPPHWLAAYCAVRRMQPPSPAILGYDPFTVRAAKLRYGWDILQLRDGRWLAIDLEKKRAVMGNDAAMPSAQTGSHYP